MSLQGPLPNETQQAASKFNAARAASKEFINFVKSDTKVVASLRDAPQNCPERWKSLPLGPHPEASRVDRMFDAWLESICRVPSSSLGTELLRDVSNNRSCHWINTSYSFVPDVELLLAINQFTILVYVYDDILEDNVELVEPVCGILNKISRDVPVPLPSSSTGIKFEPHKPCVAAATLQFVLELLIPVCHYLSNALGFNMFPMLEEYTRAVRTIRVALLSEEFTVQNYIELRHLDSIMPIWIMIALCCVRQVCGEDMTKGAVAESLCRRITHAIMSTSNDLNSLAKDYRACAANPESPPINVILVYHRNYPDWSLADVVGQLKDEHGALMEELYGELSTSKGGRLVLTYLLAGVNHTGCKRYSDEMDALVQELTTL